MNEADFRSRDIMILTGGEDEEDEEEKALNEYRLRMAALLPTAGINFTEVPQGQEDLDAGFDAFMDEEYDDYKIGELAEEEVEAQDKIDQKVIDEAVDEFIEDTKTRFLDLTKKHGTDEQRNLLPQYVKASEKIHEEDLKDGDMPEEVKQKLTDKKLQNADVFEDDAIAKIDEDPYADDKSDEEAWDAETILSTYTNTDNHPGVIKTERRVRPAQRMKIELHKQFKVPIDGLIPLAEEITVQKDKKNAAENKPYTRVAKTDGEKPPGSPCNQEGDEEGE